LKEFAQFLFIPVLILWEGFTSKYIWHEDLGWRGPFEVVGEGIKALGD
jgi:hypothetical protein